MKTIKLTIFGEKVTLKFVKNKYINNHNIYVGMVDAETEELWGDLTVNLEYAVPEPYAYLNSNSCSCDQSIIKTLEELNLIIETGETAFSGYCIYNLYKLTDEFLNEWCSDILS